MSISYDLVIAGGGLGGATLAKNIQSTVQRCW